MEKIKHIELEEVTNARGDVIGTQAVNTTEVINNMVDVVNELWKINQEQNALINSMLDFLEMQQAEKLTVEEETND